MDQRTPRIAVIGSGPTALYTLAALIGGRQKLSVTVFESGTRLGVGTPYDRERNAPEMLANIASIELPPVTETLLDWVQRDGEARLAEIGIDAATVTERTFLPRVILGDYLEAQIEALIEKSSTGPCSIDILKQARVVDIVAEETGPRISWRNSARELQQSSFDAVVVATGHQRPRERQVESSIIPAYSAAPELAKARSVAVLGTSLSAIDVVIAHAVTFGQFVERDGHLAFMTTGDDNRKLTMMSRSGLLPEADFYCPIPYEPLDVFTSEAIDRCRNLDDMFTLFARQLVSVDPAYAQSIRLSEANADTFAEHYFAPRRMVGALQWAEGNIVEVAYNHAHKFTVPWRYAILRMHEPFGAAVDRLTEEDRFRFERGIKRVFVDNYAAVPPLSILRLLALRDAGILSVIELTENYELKQEPSGWRVRWPHGDLTFDALVDARGQRALNDLDLAFPTLRLQLHALSIAQASDSDITVDESFRLGVRGTALGRIFFAALPFLLKRKPFIQGLTASCEIGTVVARTIIDDMGSDGGAVAVDLETLLAELDATSLIFCATGSGIAPLTLPSPQDRSIVPKVRQANRRK